MRAGMCVYVCVYVCVFVCVCVRVRTHVHAQGKAKLPGPDPSFVSHGTHGLKWRQKAGRRQDKSEMSNMKNTGKALASHSNECKVTCLACLPTAPTYVGCMAWAKSCSATPRPTINAQMTAQKQTAPACQRTLPTQHEPPSPCAGFSDRCA